MDNDKEEDAGEEDDDDEVAGGKGKVRIGIGIGIRQTENGCPKRKKTKRGLGVVWDARVSRGKNYVAA